MSLKLVIFSGTGVSGSPSLWVTDGTDAGTYELTGIAGASTGSNGDFTFGFIPGGFASFKGSVLFNGYDSSGHQNLWVTNGTASGTHELTGINGASASGLNPLDITVFGNEVLFNGSNASGRQGLWVSDGTALGTHEVTGINGTSTSGIFPLAMTVLGNEVLFNGSDVHGQVGLWVTDGTTAGTKEISQISPYWTGLNPSSLTALNGKVLFDGTADYLGNRSLWVSDGTANGTFQITGTAGASASLDPHNMTVFGNEILFDGRDSTGAYGLWATNGTAAGTLEIAGTSGLDPSSLTLLNGNVLFSGKDASGNYGLWVTDGSAAGTVEITGIAGARTTIGGLTPSNLTVYNNEVIFSGYDLSGATEPSLWVTDGTAAGTYKVAGSGLAPALLTLVNLSIAAPTVAITSAGGLTSNSAQKITGTVTAGGAAVAGTLVTLFDNGNVAGLATVGSNGAWSADVKLINGGNSLVARDTDAAGNAGTSNAVSFMFDPGPTVTITSTGGFTNKPAQTVSGTVTTLAGEPHPGGMVTLYDNNSQIATATVASDGSWSASVTLSGDGNHSLVAKNTDAAGMTGMSSACVLTVYTIPPTVAITLQGGITNVATQTISGTVTPGDAPLGRVILYDNGAKVGEANVSNGAWSAGVMLSKGTNTLVANETDLAGNTANSSAVTYTLDTGPTVAIDTVGTFTSVAAQKLTGRVTMVAGEPAIGSTVTIYDNNINIGTATVGADGWWSANVTLVTGNNSLVATNTDAAGYSGSSGTVNFTLGSPALFQNRLMFTGQNATGRNTVYVSDGSSVSEVTGITGVNATGLNPANYAEIGGRVLFSGKDNQGLTGLWVTDGTTTHELTGIAGANTVGVGPSAYVPCRLQRPGFLRWNRSGRHL